MPLFFSIVLSAIYFFTIPWHPFPGSWVIKAASIAILAAIAARGGGYGVARGLALSAIGDALLEFSPGLFGAGLLAFLLAHVAYTVTFVRAWRAPRFSAGIIVVVAYSIILAAWLIPAAGPLAVPVAIYVAAITAMVVSAFTVRAPLLALGALLFLISDSVLAVSRFRMPVPLVGWIVWATYYAAQVLILRGYFSARARDTRMRSAAAE